MTENNDKIICPKCKSELPQDSGFCQYCGSKIEISSAITDNNNTEEKNALIVEEVDPTDIEYETSTKILAAGVVEGHKVEEANREAQPQNEANSQFGLVPEKPIITLAWKSVDGEKEYLNQLYTTNGEKIRYERRGSMGVDGINGMIDIYDTFLPSGHPYKTIYVNMYGSERSTQAPAGFVLNHITKKSFPKPKKKKLVKVKYCSRCGSMINNETKVCTGCGKKYFKGFRFNRFSVTVIVLILIIAMLSTLCVLQWENTQRLIEELKFKVYFLEGQNSIKASTIDQKNSTIEKLEDKIADLQNENGKYEIKLMFFDNYAEIVGDDNTNLYHKYGCYKLNKSNGFLILNTEAAEEIGYTPCPKCH